MSNDRSIVLRRAFDASPPEVFELWTDPVLVSQWWGIAGSTIVSCVLDVRVGGKWHIAMRTASGQIYPNGGTYLEVVPDKRLVYLDEPDASIREWKGQTPSASRHTVTFIGKPEHTVVTMQIVFGSRADRERMTGFGIQQGLEQGLDRLEALIRRQLPTTTS